MSAQTPVPGLLRGFFEDYLAAQRDVSQNTIYASHRDACKLFLRFAARHRGRQLLRLQLADLGADTVLAFLTYLESDRHNSAATRNCRLVAIHRFFAYVADQDPRHAELCRRVLDIPLKKTTSNSMTYLNQDEVKALLAAPSARHRLGLRDRAPSFPHTLRHTTALHLLQSGAELNVIKSWLGHVSITTTSEYIEIDMAMKRKAIERCPPLVPDPEGETRWHASKDIIQWLEDL